MDDKIFKLLHIHMLDKSHICKLITMVKMVLRGLTNQKERGSLTETEAIKGVWSSKVNSTCVH